MVKKVLSLIFVISLIASQAFGAVAVKDNNTYEGEATALNFGTGLDGTLSGSTYSVTPSGSQTITGGTIDDTAIGGTTPAAGSFTTIDSSGAATLATVDGVLGSITPAAIDCTTIDSTGAATFNSVDGPLGSVTPATIVGTTIGGTTITASDKITAQAELQVSVETVTAAADAGVADPDIITSLLVTDGGGDTNEDTVTLADGTAGEIKIFVYLTETDAGDSINVTPANGAFTDILFEDPGDGCILIFDGTNWSIVANNGGTIT